MVSSFPLLSLLVGAAGLAAAQRGRPPPTSARGGNNPAPPGATQSLYGQCGGQTYTGPTACPTGSYCRHNPDNVWYSQCVPNGTPPLPEGGSGGSSADVRTLTTVFTVDGPYPTVISTQITYLQPRPPRTTATPVEIVTVTLVPDEPCEHEYYC